MLGDTVGQALLYIDMVATRLESGMLHLDIRMLCYLSGSSAAGVQVSSCW